MLRHARIPAVLTALVVAGCGGGDSAPSAIESPVVESTAPPSDSSAAAPTTTATPATPGPTTATDATPAPTTPASTAPAPAPTPVELVEWTAWTASNRVGDLAASDDAIWAATDGGLVRWDRRTGAATVLSPVPGDPDVRIRSVDVAAGGEVWVGMCGRLPTTDSEPCGVARLDATGWTLWIDTPGLIGQQSYEVAVGPDGAVWAGGIGGLSRFDGSTWMPVSATLPSSDVQSLAVAPDGTVWVGTWNGLASVSADGASHRWTDRDAQSIAITDDGVVWFGEWDMDRQAGGLWRITPGGAPELLGLEDHHIWSLASAGDAVYAGTSIIPTALGREPVETTGPLLWRATLGGLEPVPGLWDDVPPHQALAVAADRAGNAWVGGFHGFWSLDGGRYLVDGPGPWPAALDASDGAVWIAGGMDASWFDGTTWSSVEQVTGYPVDVLATSGTTAWIGTSESLVRVEDGVATEVRADPAGRPWSSYLPDTGGEGEAQLWWDLEIGPDGTVWATAGSGGLWDLTHGTRYTEADGLPSDDIRDVAVDAGGLVCVTDGRVACGTNGAWSARGEIPGADSVARVAPGAPGSLWALANRSGEDWHLLLARWSDGAWVTVPDFDATIAPAFTSDDTGAVWFGIHRGAARFDGQTTTTYQLPWFSSELRDDWDVARVVEVEPDGTLWLIDGEVLYRSTTVPVADARYGDWPLQPKDAFERGDQGDVVTYLQRVLHDRADAIGVEADGIFGPMTERAVRRIQLAAGLEVDGIVGSSTWALIDALATAP